MCRTSWEPLKTSKIDRIQQSPWRPATAYTKEHELYMFYPLFYCVVFVPFSLFITFKFKSFKEDKSGKLYSNFHFKGCLYLYYI